MRKTITAVARDAAIWREHKRRQRPGEQDETRLEGVMPARLDDDKRANDQHGRRARQDEKHRAPAERRTQRATDNRADEQDVILAEQRRETSQSRAEKRLPTRRDAHTRRMKPSNRTAARSRLFPSKRRLGPKVFHLGAEKERPSKGGATMSRKPPYASFAPALGPGEQVKSSSTCTSTPPFAVIGAPIAAKQPSAHAFNSSNCSPSLM